LFARRRVDLQAACDAARRVEGDERAGDEEQQADLDADAEKQQRHRNRIPGHQDKPSSR
jgi:hypothetical protein